MSTATAPLNALCTMKQVLEAYPGAQRALFRRYHIGGCSSCGFQPDETLGQLCARNGQLNVEEVVAHIQTSQAEDERLLISPTEAAALMAADRHARFLDVRSREEFDSAAVPGSQLLTQDLMNEMLSRWPRDKTFIVLDHQGRRCLDAAAYFLGHGFTHVRALRGGIDAWSQEVDRSIPRYRLG